MQILGLLGMYFEAVVVFVTNSSLLFRLAMAILCRYNTLPKFRLLNFLTAISERGLNSVFFYLPLLSVFYLYFYIPFLFGLFH